MKNAKKLFLSAVSVFMICAIPLAASGKADDSEVTVEKSAKDKKSATKSSEKSAQSDNPTEGFEEAGKALGELGKQIESAAKAFDKGFKEAFSSDDSSKAKKD